MIIETIVMNKKQALAINQAIEEGGHHGEVLVIGVMGRNKVRDLWLANTGTEERVPAGLRCATWAKIGPGGKISWLKVEPKYYKETIERDLNDRRLLGVKNAKGIS